jgi:hypothetical protein
MCVTPISVRGETGPRAITMAGGKLFGFTPPETRAGSRRIIRV